MARTILSILAVVVASLAVLYQLFIKPVLTQWGVGRVIQPLANSNCITVPQLQACEKIVLHQPSGSLYLACSTPESRSYWTPAVERLDASGRSTADYVAVYDHSMSRITRLTFSGMPPRDRLAGGLSLHGMDIVPSSSNPSDLWVYLINHRVPLIGDPARVGADSSIEVYRTAIGSTALTYVRTFEDPHVIVTPNDVLGSADGNSVFVTNDHGVKVGYNRVLNLLGLADSSIGYCHAETGCKIAIGHMHGNNGIVGARNNDTIYVANCLRGEIRILERQSDNSLVLNGIIKTDRDIDNLSIDHAGNLWAAGLLDLLGFINHLKDPVHMRVPSSVLRVSRNTGLSAFYGQKYIVETIFEDDGSVASATTSAAYDSERNRLFLHGLTAPHLTMCRL